MVCCMNTYDKNTNVMEKPMEKQSDKNQVSSKREYIYDRQNTRETGRNLCDEETSDRKLWAPFGRRCELSGLGSKILMRSVKLARL